MYRLLLGLAAIKATLACPDHNYAVHNNVIGKRETEVKDWNYETSFNWGKINSSMSLHIPNTCYLPILTIHKDYTNCQIGTKQAPIPLMLTQGLSQNHIPTFNYGTPVAGNIFNWEHGPAFTANTNSTPLSSSPSFTFDNETVYFKGWHIHSPADHSIQGHRTTAELHLVHANAKGKERAVVAIFIDPGNTDSAFAAQFISAPVPNFDSTTTVATESMDLKLAIAEAGDFREFWTYDGSLTSPPCTEGIRFFVSRSVMTVGNAQMQEILKVSTFSARTEQEVWMHGINV